MTNPLSSHDIDRLNRATNMSATDLIPISQNGVLRAGTADLLLVREARVATQFDVTANTTPASVTGLSFTVTAGATYKFRAHLATTCNAAGGTKANLGGTATWTSINTTVYTYTASAVVVTTGTTATPGTAIAGATAQNIATLIEGVVVINAAGTLTVQFAQNASNAAASSVLVNSYFEICRIA